MLNTLSVSFSLFPYLRNFLWRTTCNVNLLGDSNKLYGSEGYINKGVSDVQYLNRDWLITTNNETVIELTFVNLYLDQYDSDGDCEFANAIKVSD